MGRIKIQRRRDAAAKKARQRAAPSLDEQTWVEDQWWDELGRFGIGDPDPGVWPNERTEIIMQMRNVDGYVVRDALEEFRAAPAERQLAYITVWRDTVAQRIADERAAAAPTPPTAPPPDSMPPGVRERLAALGLVKRLEDA